MSVFIPNSVLIPSVSTTIGLSSGSSFFIRSILPTQLSPEDVVTICGSPTNFLILERQTNELHLLYNMASTLNGYKALDEV